jgi:phospholipase C
MPAGLDSLKHIVVLMMENRSYDHMLGFLQSPSYQINGLTGTESNNDTTGAPVQVTNDAIYYGDLTPDPDHSHFGVMEQMFDGSDPSVTPVPPMSGFVNSYEHITSDVGKSRNIMKCFSKAKVPVISTLAQQFCLCDNWFSSVPGPTFPNRAFAHAATSIGRVDMSPIGYVGISKTIYELLNDNGFAGRIFYNDTTLAATFPRLMAQMNQYFGDFQDFLNACSNNSLPHYSFIEPRYNTLEQENLFDAASDQHPDHDVQEGERLIQQVFTAIWNNTDVRNSTLLVITYDEHGGLFDHVPPPQRVPNPDGKNWAGAPGNPDPPFDFTWLGVRVPALLISPYIQPGTIDTTLYDHTSFLATTRKVFLPNWQNTFLTQRDNVANTFEDVFNLDNPRTDTISFGASFRAAIPAVSPQQLVLKPLTEHQQGLVQMAAYLEAKLPKAQQTGIDVGAIRTEGAAAKYLAQVMSKLHAAAPPAPAPKP